MQVDVIFRATAGAADSGEGLVVSLIDGQDLDVRLVLDGKERGIMLDRVDALRMIDAISDALEPEHAGRGQYFHPGNRRPRCGRKEK